MSYLNDQEPQGWRELCAKLKTERDPEKFRELLQQIDRVLTAHEKANQRRSAANHSELFRRRSGSR
jgi:hypothetical protein